MLNGSLEKGNIVSVAYSIPRYLDKTNKSTRGYKTVVGRNGMESMASHIPTFAHVLNFQLLHLEK